MKLFFFILIHVHRKPTSIMIIKHMGRVQVTMKKAKTKVAFHTYMKCEG